MTDGGANVENSGGTVMHSTGGMQEASSKETIEASSIQRQRQRQRQEAEAEAEAEARGRGGDKR